MGGVLDPSRGLRRVGVAMYSPPSGYRSHSYRSTAASAASFEPAPKLSVAAIQRSFGVCGGPPSEYTPAKLRCSRPARSRFEIRLSSHPTACSCATVTCRCWCRPHRAS